MGMDGLTITALVNRQFGLIHKLNPVMLEGEEVPLYYETWKFFRRPNRELNKARIMEGYLTVPVVIRSITSQLLMEQQHQRPPE